MSERMSVKLWWTIVAVLCAVVATFACGACLVPLLTLFRDQFGITSGDAAVTTAAYFAGCISVLFFFSRISDVFGRKPVTVVSLTFTMVSMSVLKDIDSYTAFLVIRFFQGTAAGLISSAALPWLADCLMKKSTLLASASSTGAPSLGFALGAAVIGVFLDSPTDVYAILQTMEAAVFVCIVAVLCAQDSVTKGRTKLTDALKPKLKVATHTSIGLLPVGIIFAVCWGVSSVIQGFAAAFCEALFGSQDAATMSSLLFGIFIVCNAFGTLIGVKRTVTRLQAWFAVFLASSAAALLGFDFGFAIVFYVFAATTGTLLGLVTSLALQLLLAECSAGDRAGLISLCCMSGYTGAAMTGLVGGWFASLEGIYVLNYAFLGVVSVLFLIAQMLLTRVGQKSQSASVDSGDAVPVKG